MDYKKAGVDVLKAKQSIDTLKQDIDKTKTNITLGNVLTSIGGFAGTFKPHSQYASHNIVATTDGVGTKIELCRSLKYFDPLGQDLVAMCVNDLYCMGARPAFFLDYISCGKLDDSWYQLIIKQIADACLKTNMAFLGGETAEHPGVMEIDEFDLAGFCVGMVSDQNVLPKMDTINDNDVIIGLPSSGIHSNGFSLVRYIIKNLKAEHKAEYESLLLNNQWIKNDLLAPTRLYTEIPDLIENFSIKGVAHITGGGMYEKLARIIPKSYIAYIENPSIFDKPIFQWLAKFVEPKALYETFNMGIGMTMITSESEFEKISNQNKEVQIIGRILKRTNNLNPEQSVYIKNIDSI